VRGAGGPSLELPDLVCLGSQGLRQRQVRAHINPEFTAAPQPAPFPDSSVRIPVEPSPRSHPLCCCFFERRTARNHGIASVGLPSRLATFRALPLPALGDGGASSGSSATGKGKAQQQKGTQQQQQAPARAISWWDRPHSGGQGGGSGSGQAGSSVSAAAASPTAMVELCNSEWTGLAGRLASVGSQLLAGGERRRGRGLVSPVCCIEVPQLVPAWAPKINMFLPSFRWVPVPVPPLYCCCCRGIVLSCVDAVAPIPVGCPLLPASLACAALAGCWGHLPCNLL
jgi:hypothetical protein